MNKIKIVLADDHKLVREGLIPIILGFKNVKSVDEVGDGQELIDLIETDEPDLILMDLQMPNISGIEATHYIKNKWPSIKIIALTMHRERKFIVHMIEIGIDGYLGKNSNSTELETAIETVMQGEFYGGKEVFEAVLDEVKPGKKSIPSFNTDIILKKKELQILNLTSEGCTNIEIAKKLYLSKRTIEGYKNRLLQKFDAKNGTELIAKAIKFGLISPS